LQHSFLSERLAAFLVYPLTVVGWLYVLLFQRDNRLAVFHLKQSIGLVAFTAGVTLGWAVLAWILAWVPYLFLLSMALFSLVIGAYIFAAVACVAGMINTWRARISPLPLFGRWADRLPL
jgi:uncharacterized membrane protein